MVKINQKENIADEHRHPMDWLTYIETNGDIEMKTFFLIHAYKRKLIFIRNGIRSVKRDTS
jgi:hypothetical protein